MSTPSQYRTASPTSGRQQAAGAIVVGAGKYRLEFCIAKGGCGEVWAATRVQTPYGSVSSKGVSPQGSTQPQPRPGMPPRPNSVTPNQSLTPQPMDSGATLLTSSGGGSFIAVPSAATAHAAPSANAGAAGGAGGVVVATPGHEMQPVSPETNAVQTGGSRGQSGSGGGLPTGSSTAHGSDKTVASIPMAGDLRTRGDSSPSPSTSPRDALGSTNAPSKPIGGSDGKTLPLLPPGASRPDGGKVTSDESSPIPGAAQTTPLPDSHVHLAVDDGNVHGGSSSTLLPGRGQLAVASYNNSMTTLRGGSSVSRSPGFPPLPPASKRSSTVTLVTEGEHHDTGANLFLTSPQLSTTGTPGLAGLPGANHQSHGNSAPRTGAGDDLVLHTPGGLGAQLGSAASQPSTTARQDMSGSDLPDHDSPKNALGKPPHVMAEVPSPADTKLGGGTSTTPRAPASNGETATPGEGQSQVGTERQNDSGALSIASQQGNTGIGGGAGHLGSDLERPAEQRQRSPRASAGSALAVARNATSPPGPGGRSPLSANQAQPLVQQQQEFLSGSARAAVQALSSGQQRSPAQSVSLAAGNSLSLSRGGPPSPSVGDMDRPQSWSSSTRDASGPAASFTQVNHDEVTVLTSPYSVAVKLEVAQRSKSRLQNEKNVISHLLKSVGNMVSPTASLQPPGRSARRGSEDFSSRVSSVRSAKALIGIPKALYFGKEGDYNVLVMELLGPSLRRLASYARGRLEDKTLILIAVQSIQRLEFLHANHFVHRDIKPDNIVLGRFKKSHHVYLIDFGLTRRFSQLNQRTGRWSHNPAQTGCTFRGTTRFASIRSQEGVTPSRRDDLESLAYSFLVLAGQVLPWDHVTCQDRYERRAEILQKKKEASWDTNTSTKPMLSLLHWFVRYTQGLVYDQTPNYDMLVKKFRDYATDHSIDLSDNKMQWHQAQQDRSIRSGSASESAASFRTGGSMSARSAWGPSSLVSSSRHGSIGSDLAQMAQDSDHGSDSD